MHDNNKQAHRDNSARVSCLCQWRCVFYWCASCWVAWVQAQQADEWGYTETVCETSCCLHLCRIWKQDKSGSHSRALSLQQMSTLWRHSKAWQGTEHLLTESTELPDDDTPMASPQTSFCSRRGSSLGAGSSSVHRSVGTAMHTLHQPATKHLQCHVKYTCSGQIELLYFMLISFNASALTTSLFI